jgi:hypothetical protein
MEKQFDPAKVKIYVHEWRWQGAGDALFVSLSDYNQLWALYKGFVQKMDGYADQILLAARDSQL